MRTASGWILTMLTAALPSIAHAQGQATCTVEPTTAFRGDHVRVHLPAGTMSKLARVTLQATTRPTSSSPDQLPPERIRTGFATTRHRRRSDVDVHRR